MFVTIINDCQDANAFGRQTARAIDLFVGPVVPIGVHNEMEAAGNIIDILDAGGKTDNVILVNVAPRNGKAKKWPNGTPFGYFKVDKSLIVSSIDGYALSLIKKFGLATEIQVMDIPTVLAAMVEQNHIEPARQEYITNTQFRSFEFLPRAAHWITDGFNVPSTPYAITEVPDAPHAVWFVDNFGNCKTTMLPDDVEFAAGKKLQTNFGEITCYNRLKDVPDAETGIIIGSSGYKDKRFLEFVIQGQSAANKYNLKPGDPLL